MTVIIERIETAFGEAYVVTATKDKFHKTIVKEFFSYTDAQLFGISLLKSPLDNDILSMFKRKGI